MGAPLCMGNFPIVIPAKAYREPSFPRKRTGNRHSRESVPGTVIPAKAGIHLLPTGSLLSSHL